jgi:hypothetical protein
MAITITAKEHQQAKKAVDELRNTLPIWVPEFNSDHWPYQHVLSREYSAQQVWDCQRWCRQNFPGRAWRSAGLRFGFKRAQDFQWFAIKWAK